MINDAGSCPSVQKIIDLLGQNELIAMPPDFSLSYQQLESETNGLQWIKTDGSNKSARGKSLFCYAIETSTIEVFKQYFIPGSDILCVGIAYQEDKGVGIHYVHERKGGDGAFFVKQDDKNWVGVLTTLIPR